MTDGVKRANKTMMTSLAADLRTISNELGRLKMHDLASKMDRLCQNVKEVDKQSLRCEVVERILTDLLDVVCGVKCNGKIVNAVTSIVERAISMANGNNKQCINKDNAELTTDIVWTLMMQCPSITCSTTASAEPFLPYMGCAEMRVLKIVSLLVSTHPDLAVGAVLARNFAICLRFTMTSESAVCSVARATARQMLPYVYERRKCEDRNRHSDDGLRLLQDILALFADSPSSLTFLPGLDRTIDFVVGLDLVHEILAGYPDYFLRLNSFESTIRDSISPLIVQMLATTQQSDLNLEASSVSRTTITFGRILALVSCILVEYVTLAQTECEIFIASLVQFARSCNGGSSATAEDIWKATLSLEILYQSMRVYADLSQTDEKYVQTIGDIVNCTAELLYSQLGGYDDGQSTVDIHGVGFVCRDGSFIDHCNDVTNRYQLEAAMVEKINRTHVSVPYVTSLLYSMLLDFVAMATRPGSGMGEIFSSQVVRSAMADLIRSVRYSAVVDIMSGIAYKVLMMIVDCSEMLCQTRAETAPYYVGLVCHACFPTSYVLSPIEGVIGRHKSDSTLAMSVEQIVVTSKALNVKSLSRQSIHHSSESGLNEGTNFVSLSTFHLAAMLYSVDFAVRSAPEIECQSIWNILLTTIHHTSSLLRNSDDTIVTGAASKRVMAINETVDKFFAKSGDSSEAVAASIVAELISIGRSTENDVFVVQRLTEVAKVNCHRSNAPFFKQILDFIQTLCSSTDPSARSDGMKMYANIIHDMPTKTNLDAILSPLVDMASDCNGYSDLLHARLAIVDAILSNEERVAEMQDFAWSAILNSLLSIAKILSTAKDDSQSRQLLQTDLDCVKTVVEKYLSRISSASSFNQLEDVLFQIGSTKLDLNTSLTSISLFWHIVDYLAAKGAERQDLSQLWFDLFDRLGRLCLETTGDSCKSACQTFFTSLVQNADHIPPDVWHRVQEYAVSTVSVASLAKCESSLDTTLADDLKRLIYLTEGSITLLVKKGDESSDKIHKTLLIRTVVPACLKFKSFGEPGDLSGAIIKSFYKLSSLAAVSRMNSSYWSTWTTVGTTVVPLVADDDLLDQFVLTTGHILRQSSAPLSRSESSAAVEILKQLISHPGVHASLLKLVTSMSNDSLASLTWAALQNSVKESKKCVDVRNVEFAKSMLETTERRFHSCDIQKSQMVGDILQLLETVYSMSSLETVGLFDVANRILFYVITNSTALIIAVPDQEEKYSSCWLQLASVVSQCLVKPTILDGSVWAEQKADDVRCSLLDHISAHFMSQPSSAVSHPPSVFIQELIDILHASSVHAPISDGVPTLRTSSLSSILPVRQGQFAAKCLQALLSFSLLGLDSSSTADLEMIRGQTQNRSRNLFNYGLVRLLRRIERVICDAIEDKTFSESAPLPRRQVEQTLSALDALATVVKQVTMDRKNFRPTSDASSFVVDRVVISLVLDLYPHLVRLITVYNNNCISPMDSGGNQVTLSTSSTLMQYHDLMKVGLDSSVGPLYDPLYVD